MAEPDRPPWHWDEVRALHRELAEQTESAATIIAALKAEVARLETEKTELLASRAFWQEKAEQEGERARVATQALARALRTQ